MEEEEERWGTSLDSLVITKLESRRGVIYILTKSLSH